VGAHRIEETALPFRKNNIERERALAGATYAGDDDEFSARDRDREIFEIVLARADNRDRVIGWNNCLSFVNHGSASIARSCSFPIANNAIESRRLQTPAQTLKLDRSASMRFRKSLQASELLE